MTTKDAGKRAKTGTEGTSPAAGPQESLLEGPMKNFSTYPLTPLSQPEAMEQIAYLKAKLAEAEAAAAQARKDAEELLKALEPNKECSHDAEVWYCPCCEYDREQRIGTAAAALRGKEKP